MGAKPISLWKMAVTVCSTSAPGTWFGTRGVGGSNPLSPTILYSWPFRIRLQWADIDWEKLEVRIQRAVVMGVAGKVKTVKSKAPMPLDPDLATVLLLHQHRVVDTGTPSVWVLPIQAQENPGGPRISSRSSSALQASRPPGWTESAGTTSATRSPPCCANSGPM